VAGQCGEDGVYGIHPRPCHQSAWAGGTKVGHRVGVT
jgi:hypothetical protein